MAQTKKKPAPCGRFKSGPKKGRAKPCKARKGGKAKCKCHTLPECVKYIKKAYRMKKIGTARLARRKTAYQSGAHGGTFPPGYYEIEGLAKPRRRHRRSK